MFLFKCVLGPCDVYGVVCANSQKYENENNQRKKRKKINGKMWLNIDAGWSDLLLRDDGEQYGLAA